MKKSAIVLCLVLSALPSLYGQGADAVLARMDAAAPGFHGMFADVSMTTHTAIINDDTTEQGTLKMQRLRLQDVRAILDFSSQPDAREIAFYGKIIQIYYPKLKAYQEYDVGKNSQALNQFLLLGFGSSGKDLAQSYQISAEGADKIGGQDTIKLVLIPKDSAVKQRLSKIEMWIPSHSSYPVQQEFYEPSGNYRIVTYSNTKLNPSIKGKLELKLPSDVKKQG